MIYLSIYLYPPQYHDPSLYDMANRRYRPLGDSTPNLRYCPQRLKIFIFQTPRECLDFLFYNLGILAMYKVKNTPPGTFCPIIFLLNHPLKISIDGKSVFTLF